MTFSAAAELTGGTLHGMDGVFSGVRIDSRAVQRGELFVAIRGDRLDGHDFVADAADRGAAGALVARRTDADISQVAVADTTVALGRLALNWRRAFDIPVIGITGSNGKTTVTAMVREILSVSGHPLAPRGKLQQSVGSPPDPVGTDRRAYPRGHRDGDEPRRGNRSPDPDCRPYRGAGQQRGRRPSGGPWLRGACGRGEGRDLQRARPRWRGGTEPGRSELRGCGRPWRANAGY